MHAPLVHIGYHRAGSTWLQRFLFRPENGFLQPFDRARDVGAVLIAPHPLDFAVEAARAHFAAGLADAERRGLVPAISAERLSGYPDSGGYDTKEIADRLKAVLPEARVLIAIRRQADILLSFYKVYVAVGGTLRLADYVSPPARGRMRMPRFSYDHFAYHRLVGYYQGLFGAERVLVLPFEDIAAEPAAAAAGIARFVGAADQPDVSAARRVNESLSGATVMAKRLLNPFLARDAANGYSTLSLPGLGSLAEPGFQYLDRRLPAGLRAAGDRRLRRQVERLLFGRYAESNRRVQELTGLDLGRRSYDV